MTNLHGNFSASRDLVKQDLDMMYALLQEHYEGTTPEIFMRDLAGKNWVIRLFDDAGRLQGFSTLAVYATEVQGESLSVVCSGDTIVRPAFWGASGLAHTWLRTVLAVSEGLPRPLYWLLISSGYRTYRFLPAFYREFYPRGDKPTPPKLQSLMNTLALDRYGGDFLPDLGIVRFREGATPLRRGIADVSPELLNDPHISFFVTRNPGYLEGDEMVCLAEIDPDNLTPAGQSILRSLAVHD